MCMVMCDGMKLSMIVSVVLGFIDTPPTSSGFVEIVASL